MDIPWWYYLISFVVCLVVCFLWKKPSLGLLVGYIFLVLAETVLIRDPFVGEHLKLELFWSWRVWSIQRRQIVTNVIMFMPIGFFSGWLWKWRGLFIAIILSASIEFLQLITQRGLMEFDDVMHNCLGALIGIGFVMLIKKVLSLRAVRQ